MAFANADSLQPKGREVRQLVEVQKESLHDSLLEVKVAGGKEIREQKNSDSDDSSAESVVGD